MSVTGVTINSTDTLTTWGLIMLDDLVISAPIPKTAYVDLPGADGSLDYSDALVGHPVFEDRTITFTLFKHMDESTRNSTRTALLASFGGQKVTLVTPDLAGWYWSGRMTIGELSGYNAGRIPISVRVSPYRLKSSVTTATETLSANTPKTVTLASAGMPTVPTFNCTKACTLTDPNGGTHSIDANTDYTSADFLITGSGITITAQSASSATLTVKYQEGTL